MSHARLGRVKTAVTTLHDHAETSSSSSLREGAQAGPWVIEGELGRGGMGVVYAVKHSRIGKRAALKVLQRRLTDLQLNAERMLLEAQVVNAIGHPGIVDIFDVGATDDGRPYIVMEYLAGRSLAEHEPDVDEALAILGQVSDALIAAHDAGVVHRDLKPENIFLVETGGGAPRVKLLDWGIARKLHAETRHTFEGQVVGTPRYLAPEQARGEPVTAKTDVYSLGVVAYELLLLQPPFVGTNSTELLAMHLLVEPRPPRELWPDIPDHLDRLLRGMLMKAPAARPTMREVAAQLSRGRDAVLRPVAIQAPALFTAPLPPSIPASRPLCRKPRSRRGWKVAAGVLALGVLCTLGWLASRREPVASASPEDVVARPAEAPRPTSPPAPAPPAIAPAAALEDCADPSIARVGSRWYATCTGGRSGNLYPIHASSDLRTWRQAGWIFPFGAKPAWADGNFWAPELHATRDGFAAYFSMREIDGRNAIGVATASRIEGPYHDPGAPLVAPSGGASDAHLLVAGDARYLFYKDEQKPASIWVQPLSADGTSVEGPPARVLAATESWERDNLEAPWVSRVGDYYYLFYSGARYCEPDYAIGVARARSPLGPFEKHGPPVVSRDDVWIGPGHAALVEGPAGVRYLAHHAYRSAEGMPSCAGTRSQRRHVRIQQLTFADGWPRLGER